MSATNNPASRFERIIWLASAAAFAVAALVLFLFDPSQYGFYPVCPLHLWTGLDCPGCGSLRAVHQLAHGNFRAAWGLNPLTVSLLPVAAWLGAREFARVFFGKQWPGVVTRPAFAWALGVIVVLFGVLRNIPAARL